MTLTEAEKIARYDAERNGTAYLPHPTAPTDPSDALTSILEWIEEHFALDTAAEGTIEVSYLYHDPAHGNDITDKPIGPVAYTDYACGEDDAQTFISFDAEGGGAQVSLFGHDPVDLDRLERTLANLQALLSDPRVKALREAQE